MSPAASQPDRPASGGDSASRTGVPSGFEIGDSSAMNISEKLTTSRRTTGSDRRRSPVRAQPERSRTHAATIRNVVTLQHRFGGQFTAI